MTHARPCRRDHYEAASASIALVLLLATALSACGGGGEERPGAADTAAPGATSATPAGATSMSEAQLVALGDSIFEGKAAGGICYTCHGPDGTGTQLAPDLTDQQWLNGDGSVEFIANVVRNGVQQPKQFPAPMPPFGATLNDQQLRAVSAYVYSLSHADA
jgi:mono/diheme cytochrome c family protein